MLLKEECGRAGCRSGVEHRWREDLTDNRCICEYEGRAQMFLRGALDGQADKSSNKNFFLDRRYVEGCKLNQPGGQPAGAPKKGLKTRN